MRGAPAPPPLTHPTRGSDQASRVVGRRRPAPSRAMRRWNYPYRSRTTTTASSSSSAVPLRMEQICTVPIDQNRSFLIMRLRLVEMLSTVVNIIHGTVALTRFDQLDLDRTAERKPNSQHYSYSAQMQRIQIHAARDGHPCERWRTLPSRMSLRYVPLPQIKPCAVCGPRADNLQFCI
jgi:hypothetical protein